MKTNRKETSENVGILKDNVSENVTKLGLRNTWISQQDNDPKNIVEIVKLWLLYRIPNLCTSIPVTRFESDRMYMGIINSKLKNESVASKESLRNALKSL
ncbi:hypothetical protein AVEN_235072-1 [Araneus ventricosus]|uniref:Uncharacterized protein n=1 Tax=Araneus ventricosus TaxID=182803 RepID=A0A4Y2PWM0_ARAVE|nr:hypothetical protein AVEN_235072-1 [Araneus ventricosus]